MGVIAGADGSTPPLYPAPNAGGVTSASTPSNNGGSRVVGNLVVASLFLIIGILSLITAILTPQLPLILGILPLRVFLLIEGAVLVILGTVFILIVMKRVKKAA